MKKVLFASLSAWILMSCGGGSTEAPVVSEPEAPAEKEVVAEPQVSDEVAKITLSSSDQMQYDKKKIKVKVGQKVELTLTHTGTMPKNVMGHNFVLLKAGVDVSEFAGKAATAKDNDYIPEGDDIIANTTLIGGGESVTIMFDAPEAGTYDFICSFPGHYGIMKGKFVVQ